MVVVKMSRDDEQEQHRALITKIHAGELPWAKEGEIF